MDLTLNGILRFLNRFGYLDLPNDAGKWDDYTKPEGFIGHWSDGSRDAMAKYQEVNGLPITGRHDDDMTLALMCERRCGHPDAPYALRSQAQTLKWGKLNLTWKFANYTLDIPQYEISDSFNKGFGVWSMVTPLTFTEVLANEQADINITFKRLDTVGNVLAQAYFPPVGRMEFDESETWCWKLPLGRGQVDLATIVAHESGHVIGLDHSNVRGAQMAPVYAGPMRHLASDDIRRAQSLYGSRS